MKTIKEYIIENGCCGNNSKPFKNLPKKIKEGKSDVEPWMFELAELMGCDNINNIKEMSHDNPWGVEYVNTKMYSDGKQEWVVFGSYKDAEQCAIEDTKRLAEECGFPTDSFNIEDFVGEDFIKRIADEEGETAVAEWEEENPQGEDEDDDEYYERSQEVFDERYDEIVDYFSDYLSGMFGNTQEMTEWLIKQDAIDLDKFAEYAVETYGAFNQLAGYDGNHYELSDGKYCCRHN